MLLACAAATAQTAGETPDNEPDTAAQPLFASQETLVVRIEAPFRKLMRERSETGELEGTLSYADPSGIERGLDVKLRTRGIFRRQKDTCEFAPIRVNFRKSQVEDTVFAGQDKLKLVTHCENGSDTYEQYVLKEYLAYRIFNVLTDDSFRARLMHVTYVDSDRDGESQTRYAFFIEDNDRLAERIGAGKVEVRQASYALLEEKQAALVTVFEYLIGNTDFSMIGPDKGKDCCHNIELFSREPGIYIAIPYDFDFSGIVDARYAEPHPSLDIRSVVRRQYRGVCSHNDVMEETVAQFRSRQGAISQLPSTIDGMDDRVRGKAENYIGEFYEDIADAEAVEDNLVRECYSAG
jgi:hypothetical protein